MIIEESEPEDLTPFAKNLQVLYKDPRLKQVVEIDQDMYKEIKLSEHQQLDSLKLDFLTDTEAKNSLTAVINKQRNLIN
jgi:hypothetical protein